MSDLTETDIATKNLETIMGKNHCEGADGNDPTKSDRPNVGNGTSSSAGMGSTYIPPSILPVDKRASYLSGSGKGPLRQEVPSALEVAEITEITVKYRKMP